MITEHTTVHNTTSTHPRERDHVPATPRTAAINQSRTHHPTPRKGQDGSSKDARVHYTVLKQQPTHPTPRWNTRRSPRAPPSRDTRTPPPDTHPQGAGKPEPTHPPPRRPHHGDHQNTRACCLRTQQCAMDHTPPTGPHRSTTTPRHEDEEQQVLEKNPAGHQHPHPRKDRKHQKMQPLAR